MARMWDEITRWAEREGLGNAVRLHREYRGARWPWWAGGVTAVLLTPVPFFLREASFPFWQLLPLAWSVPIGAALLWQYLAPVRHRRWYAVASGGLLVYSPAGPIIAIPWKALRRTESGGLRQRVAGKSVPLEIPPVAGRSDLMLSLRSRRVVPSTLRWLPAWPQRGLVAVAVLWLIGFPLAVSAFENWRPSSLARLTDLCEDGDPFPGAPRYEGAGPHPMAVAGIVTEPVEVWGGEGGAEPAASDVQLVGCVRPIGQSAPRECRYDGDFVQTVHQGRYRVDVLEVGTSREIDSFPVNGVAPTCDYLVSVDEGVEEGGYDTVPDRADYEDHVLPLVTEPAN